MTEETRYPTIAYCRSDDIQKCNRRKSVSFYRNQQTCDPSHQAKTTQSDLEHSTATSKLKRGKNIDSL